MSHNRSNIRYRIGNGGYGFIENEPEVSQQTILNLIPADTDPTSLRYKILTAIAEYVASTNQLRKKKTGRDRAERIAVLVNQLCDSEELNDSQLAARVMRLIELQDNEDRKPKGPFESSVELRAFVMRTICQHLNVPENNVQQQTDETYQQRVNYVRAATSTGAGTYAAAAMPRREDVLLEVRLKLAKARLKEDSENEHHAEPVQSQFVQDLVKAINDYQHSIKYHGCCLPGRVKLWKQTGFDRSVKLRKLIVEEMLGTERLSDEQIKTQLQEMLDCKRHIGIFDTSKQLRASIRNVLNNSIEQQNRIDVAL